MTHALRDDARVRTEDMTRIVLRPLATPLPLGVLVLGIGSILLTSLQLGWIAVTNTHQVATVLLVFVVPLELLTAALSFYIRDVVMATGFGLLTGMWAASGTLLLSGQPGSRSQVFGELAIAGAVALLVPALSVAWAKPAATVLMIVAAVRFALVGVYELNGASGWQTASGVVGVVLVVTAAYGSLAFALEDARHHAVLPIKRTTTSSAAMSGEIAPQLEDLPTEAGVRQES